MCNYCYEISEPPKKLLNLTETGSEVNLCNINTYCTRLHRWVAREWNVGRKLWQPLPSGHHILQCTSYFNVLVKVIRLSVVFIIIIIIKA